MKRFGEKLRTLRKRRGLLQREVGDMLGVTEAYVGKMEQGQKIPNIAMLTKICDIFSVSCDKLIRDEFELD